MEICYQWVFKKTLGGFFGVGFLYAHPAFIPPALVLLSYLLFLIRFIMILIFDLDLLMQDKLPITINCVLHGINFSIQTIIKKKHIVQFKFIVLICIIVLRFKCIFRLKLYQVKLKIKGPRDVCLF